MWPSVLEHLLISMGSSSPSPAPPPPLVEVAAPPVLGASDASERSRLSRASLGSDEQESLRLAAGEEAVLGEATLLRLRPAWYDFGRVVGRATTEDGTSLRSGFPTSASPVDRGRDEIGLAMKSASTLWDAEGGRLVGERQASPSRAILQRDSEKGCTVSHRLVRTTTEDKAWGRSSAEPSAGRQRGWQVAKRAGGAVAALLAIHGGLRDRNPRRPRS
jgi:hypothetical protein